MLKNILIQQKTMHFKEPFQIAYEKVTAADIVVIKLTDAQGHCGLGSAAPDEQVTAETVDAAYDLLKKKLNTKFFDSHLENWYYYHQKIQQEFIGWPACQSAVEEAMLNLFCSTKKISLVNLFGGYRPSCPIIITIGIKSIAQTLTEVKKRIKQQYKIIKLKGGLQLAQDISKLKAINKILPSHVALIFDANQGYSFDQAKKLLPAADKLKVKLIEQPLHAKNIKDLKKLSKLSPIPIIADEAAVTLDDAIQLLTQDYADGLNIKLMKCGGPVNFIKIFELAKKLNKIIMIGCMYESQISITTGAALALALPIDYVDLDSGRLDFPDDPASGGALIRQGQIQKIKQLELTA